MTFPRCTQATKERIDTQKKQDYWQGEENNGWQIKSKCLLSIEESKLGMEQFNKLF